MNQKYPHLETNRRVAILNGGSRGRKGRGPPGPKFLHFHAVFGQNWSNSRLAPPLRNPRSATATYLECVQVVITVYVVETGRGG